MNPYVKQVRPLDDCRLEVLLENRCWRLCDPVLQSLAHPTP
jgi:hypothetical protein